MTEAQKEAYQIIDQHRTIIRKADQYSTLEPIDEVYLSKQCAIIQVKSIIKAIDFDWMESQNLQRQFDYWYDVLEEIEK